MSNTMHIALPSISCGGCVSAVEKALGELAGVSEFEVSLAEHQAKVTGTAASAAVIKAIEDAGFTAELIKE